jgi:hypothetical protein
MKSLGDVSCARFPIAAAAALADLRCRSDIDVLPDGEYLWLRWAGDEEVLHRVLPLSEVELFVERADG